MSNKCKRVGRRRTVRQMPITRFMKTKPPEAEGNDGASCLSLMSNLVHL